MKRAIVVVIDSMGIGAMPDCRDFNDVPELVDTFRLYRHQARRYGCWFVYFKLMILGTMRRFGNPLIIINQLQNLRCDFGKLFKMIRE